VRIDGRTELYGIIGNPVGHSLSPLMHNAAFAALGLNKAYLPFPAEDVKSAVDGLRALGVRGVSVTIPHKEAVMAHLDDIDPTAARIGAVNTLVFEGEMIHGLNTDWVGANRALEGLIGPLKGRSVLILGAGGSARAIGFGLLRAGAEVTLASRTPERGQALAKVLGVSWHPLERAHELEGSALVNATSVGMTPNDKQSPVMAQALKNFSAVMDIVYAPLETQLLRDAAAAGVMGCNGLEMLLHQGAAQFECWTGKRAPLEVMRKALLEMLSDSRP